MSDAVWAIVCSLALIGHAALWLDCFRRTAASNVPCWAVKAVERASVVAFLFFLLAVGWQYAHSRFAHYRWSVLASSVGPYWLLCTAFGARHVAQWTIYRLWGPRAQDRLLRQTTVDLAEAPGTLAASFGHRLLLSLPGNEATQLELNHKQLHVAGMWPELDGLRIVHLSDLHITSLWQPRFYERVVELVASTTADVAVITGDIIESHSCLSWLEVLRQIQAPFGTYYVLGNHDKRLGNVAVVRRMLADAGWVSLGGEVRIVWWRGVPVLLAGNERPWLGREPQEPLPAGDFGLRVALVHTPDQFAWAKRLRFQVVLAGHTHGGQIQIPGIGPLVVPCHTGIRYAAGTYYESGTVMHVSRGVSSLHPIRYYCRPEVSWLTLRAGETSCVGPELSQSTRYT